MSTPEVEPAPARRPSHEQDRPTYNAGSYWDNRYSDSASTKHFDWFYNYPALQPLLSQLIAKDKKVLQIGCGNSDMAAGLALDGFSTVNVDISPVVIEQMRGENPGNAALSFQVADCRSMPQLDDGAFGSCIDKGTLDAVLCSQTGGKDAAAYLAEVWRLLAPGGTFLLISLGAPAARLATLRHQAWSEVQVLLLPKPLLYLQSEATLSGRPPPASGVDKNHPIDHLGPWPADGSDEELKKVDQRNYFFAYACIKPQ